MFKKIIKSIPALVFFIGDAFLFRLYFIVSRTIQYPPIFMTPKYFIATLGTIIAFVIITAVAVFFASLGVSILTNVWGKDKNENNRTE